MSPHISPTGPITAEQHRLEPLSLTHFLSGTWYGSYGCAPCPVCQPEGRPDQRALNLAEGSVGLLLHCKEAGCSFRDIISTLKLPQAQLQHRKTDISTSRHSINGLHPNSRFARRIWNSASEVCGSLADVYLRGRGITCSLPRTLRFHPDLWHGPSRRTMPAMIAHIEGVAGMAIHRTWLKPDGRGKSEWSPARAMLGQSAGGAVHLTDNAAGSLIVAEGIETALSLKCLLNRPASVWAALSTSGVRKLVLPAQPCCLVLAPDGDDPGRAAAQELAQRARRAGWRVAWRDPGDGRDWNDILRLERLL
jgi:hypothetical protein